MLGVDQVKAEIACFSNTAAFMQLLLFQSTIATVGLLQKMHPQGCNFVAVARTCSRVAPRPRAVPEAI
jgi:hypothetical protein